MPPHGIDKTIGAEEVEGVPQCPLPNPKLSTQLCFRAKIGARRECKCSLTET